MLDFHRGAKNDDKRSKPLCRRTATHGALRPPLAWSVADQDRVTFGRLVSGVSAGPRDQGVVVAAASHSVLPSGAIARQLDGARRRELAQQTSPSLCPRCGWCGRCWRDQRLAVGREAMAASTRRWRRCASDGLDEEQLLAGGASQRQILPSRLAAASCGVGENAPT